MSHGSRDVAIIRRSRSCGFYLHHDCQIEGFWEHKHPPKCGFYQTPLFIHSLNLLPLPSEFVLIVLHLSETAMLHCMLSLACVLLQTLPTSAEETASTGFLAPPTTKKVNCVKGDLRPVGISIEDCMQVFLSMPQDIEPITITSGGDFWTQSAGRCGMRIRLTGPPDERTTWSFLHISALWYKTYCQGPSGVRLAAGTMKTGPNGRIEIAISKLPRRNAQEDSGENGRGNGTLLAD